jgi:hypothetical protein
VCHRDAATFCHSGAMAWQVWCGGTAAMVRLLAMAMLDNETGCAVND